MELTFSCPECGKEYDLPWAMAGKRARCKQCSTEFVVPAPFEPKGPRSSEAIPVVKADKPSRSSSVPRTTKIEVPPPTKGSADPAPRPIPIDTLTPKHLEPLRIASSEPDSPDRPPRSREGEPILARGALAPKPVVRAPKPPARPAWLIPAIVAGGISLILAVNVGFYLAFFGAGGTADEPAGPNPPDLAALAEPSQEPPAEVVALPPAVPTSAPSPAPTPTPISSAKKSPPAPPAKAVEEIPDRVLTTAEIVAKCKPSVALIKRQEDCKVSPL